MTRNLLTSSSPWDDALALALDRGVMPTALSSAEGRAVFATAAKERAVFSARTTSAAYLQVLDKRLVRMMEGGFDSDRPQLRLELKQWLAELAYDPETGFPGDKELDIPPAKPGSLRDLSSDRRINFILDTQQGLMRGAALEARGLERAELFPAWELIRTHPRKTPRGEMGTMNWEIRWVQAGGPVPVIDSTTGAVRLIALKTDPIWKALGDSSRFDDALDVSHPPFAFNSGKGWREMPKREWDALVAGGDVEGGNRNEVEIDGVKRSQRESERSPGPTASVPVVALPKGLTPELLARLRALNTPDAIAALERRRNAP